MKQIAAIEKSLMKDNVPVFSPGDTVKVHVKIKEGDKERIQIFQGTVIGRRGGGLGETFTVRKISSGVGVERIFPVHSPNIAKIQRVRQGKVRRAKLYYLRGLTGKSARIEERLDEKAKAAVAAEKQAEKEALEAKERAEAEAKAKAEAEAKAKADAEAKAKAEEKAVAAKAKAEAEAKAKAEAEAAEAAEEPKAEEKKDE